MTTNQNKVTFLIPAPSQKLSEAAHLKQKQQNKTVSPNSVHRCYPRLPVSGCVSLWCHASCCHWIFHWPARRWPRKRQSLDWWRARPPRLSAPGWHNLRISPCAGGGRCAARSWRTAWSRRCCSGWGSATGRSRSTPSRGRWPRSPPSLNGKGKRSKVLLSGRYASSDRRRGSALTSSS